jgi:hypothetical protein
MKVFAIALVLALCAGRASAQNLFEVQVFPDEVLTPGETTVELHNVVLPSHLHLSVEITRRWTDSFETGVFLETSPSESDQHAALTGFHFRPKYRFAPRGAMSRFPFHTSLSVEYAFMKQPGDTSFRQALAITPILERHVRGLEVSFNPAIEIGLRGPQAGEAPVFEPSAKVASRLASSVWFGVEYYAETGSIKHFEPLADQHHLIMPALDLRTAAGWDLNVGVGRGLTGGSEHWVLKWIVGLRLPR